MAHPLAERLEMRECAACFDHVEQFDIVRISRRDIVCLDCFNKGVKPTFHAALKSETQYPPRWAGAALDISMFLRHFDDVFIRRFRKKEYEYKMQRAKRIYCYSHRCQKFLGKKTISRAVRKCSDCGRTTCARCGCRVKHNNIVAHVCTRADNAHNMAGHLQSLRRGRDYQLCPGCQMPVDLRDGCNHMTCPLASCRAQFCFICGERATGQSKHWDQGAPCPRYNQPSPDDVAATPADNQDDAGGINVLGGPLLAGAEGGDFVEFLRAYTVFDALTGSLVRRPEFSMMIVHPRRPQLDMTIHQRFHVMVSGRHEQPHGALAALSQVTVAEGSMRDDFASLSRAFAQLEQQADEYDVPNWRIIWRMYTRAQREYFLAVERFQAMRDYLAEHTAIGRMRQAHIAELLRISREVKRRQADFDRRGLTTPRWLRDFFEFLNMADIQESGLSIYTVHHRVVSELVVQARQREALETMWLLDGPSNLSWEAVQAWPILLQIQSALSAAVAGHDEWLSRIAVTRTN